MASLPPSLPPTVNAEFVLRDHMNPLVKVNLSPCLHSRARPLVLSLWRA